MPRPLRPQFDGAIYHLNSVGVRRTSIFVDDRCHEMFLALLDVCVSRYYWTCGSYCLLANHYRLLIRTADANVARGMQFLNGTYAQWFNQEYGYRGHAFESRYHSVLVESSEQLMRATRYIALNPVAAGLCAAPSDWKWSSYAALVGIERPRQLLTPYFVLREISDDRERSQAGLRSMVEGLPPPDWPPPKQPAPPRRCG